MVRTVAVAQEGGGTVKGVLGRWMRSRSRWCGSTYEGRGGDRVWAGGQKAQGTKWYGSTCGRVFRHAD